MKMVISDRKMKKVVRTDRELEVSAKAGPSRLGAWWTNATVAPDGVSKRFRVVKGRPTPHHFGRPAPIPPHASVEPVKLVKPVGAAKHVKPVEQVKPVEHVGT
jgi:hypothetical protein